MSALSEALVPTERDVIVAKESQRQIGGMKFGKRESVAVRIEGKEVSMPSAFMRMMIGALAQVAEGKAVAIMPCDTPVVATDVGAVRDALCPETSRLVRPGDLPALVRALRDVIDQRSRPSPRAFVARHFDWDATLRRYTLLAKG